MQNKNLKKLLILPFIAMVVYFVFAEEAKAVDIAVETTWTKENSPYIIQDSVVVTSEATLTIDSGVVIKFTSGASLVIDGKLYANGRSNDKIMFTSVKDDQCGGDTNDDGTVSIPSHGDWNQIVSNATADANIEHAKIKYGNGNGPMINIVARLPCCVSPDQWNKAVITDSFISFSQTYGVYDDGWHTVISRNIVSDNKIHGTWMEPNYKNEISYNNIHDNGTVIVKNLFYTCFMFIVDNRKIRHNMIDCNYKNIFNMLVDPDKIGTSFIKFFVINFFLLGILTTLLVVL